METFIERFHVGMMLSPRVVPATGKPFRRRAPRNGTRKPTNSLRRRHGETFSRRALPKVPVAMTGKPFQVVVSTGEPFSARCWSRSRQEEEGEEEEGNSPASSPQENRGDGETFVLRGGCFPVTPIPKMFPRRACNKRFPVGLSGNGAIRSSDGET